MNEVTSFIISFFFMDKSKHWLVNTIKNEIESSPSKGEHEQNIWPKSDMKDGKETVWGLGFGALEGGR